VQPKTFEDNQIVAQQGGTVAKVSLQELEAKTRKKVVSKMNAKSLGSNKIKRIAIACLFAMVSKSGKGFQSKRKC